MDDVGVSQILMQKNPITFFFLNTPSEMYTWQAFNYTNYLFLGYWKVITNATNTFWGQKIDADNYHEWIILDYLPLFVFKTFR